MSGILKTITKDMFYLYLNSDDNDVVDLIKLIDKINNDHPDTKCRVFEEWGFRRSSLSTVKVPLRMRVESLGIVNPVKIFYGDSWVGFGETYKSAIEDCLKQMERDNVAGASILDVKFFETIGERFLMWLMEKLGYMSCVGVRVRVFDYEEVDNA